MTYDHFNGTALTGRLQEIVFSNYQFWLTAAVSVTVCIIPIVFYFKAQSLLFPSIKDLILMDALNEKEVLEEADPKKEKAATELFK